MAVGDGRCARGSFVGLVATLVVVFSLGMPVAVAQNEATPPADCLAAGGTLLTRENPTPLNQGRAGELEFWTPAGEQRGRIALPDAMDVQPTIDPAQVVVNTSFPRAYLVDLAAGTTRRLSPGDGASQRATAAGAFVVVPARDGQRGNMLVLDVRTGESVALGALVGESIDVTLPFLVYPSPDRTSVVIELEAATLLISGSVDNAAVLRPGAPIGQADVALFSPDSTALVYAEQIDGEYVLILRSLRDGNERPIHRSEGESSSVAFAGEERIAIADPGGEITLLDRDGGGAPQRLTTAEGTPRVFIADPDGEHAVLMTEEYGDEGTSERWLHLDLGTGQQNVIEELDDAVLTGGVLPGESRWLPVGRSNAASGDGSMVGLLDVREGDVLVQPLPTIEDDIPFAYAVGDGGLTVMQSVYGFGDVWIFDGAGERVWALPEPPPDAPIRAQERGGRQDSATSAIPFGSVRSSPDGACLSFVVTEERSEGVLAASGWLVAAQPDAEPIAFEGGIVLAWLEGAD